jgi:hypothetical protein
LKIEKWEYNSDKIRFGINPKLFLAEVERDFDRYISDLRNSSPEFDNLRGKFDKLWTEVWGRTKELSALADSGKRDLQM